MVVAGLIYVVLAIIVKLVGPELITSIFPPIVTGPIIMVIGLNLAPTAIDMASANWLLAIICLLVVTVVNIFGKGFIRVLPVLCGLVVGYIVSIFMGLIDFSTIAEAAWVAVDVYKRQG